MILNMVYGGGKSDGLPIFTYSGQSQVVFDMEGGGWRLGFLSSGTLVLDSDVEVDIFLCGGGAGGQSSFNKTTTPTNFYGKGGNDGGLSTKTTNYSKYAGNGGGGGYTQTYKKIKLQKDIEYSVVVGAGGSANAAGGESSFGQYNEYIARGGDGAVATTNTATVGSSDGTPGQDSTTREFGEETGELYAGGGGAGACKNASGTAVNPGGAGGAGGSISAISGGGTHDASSSTKGGTGAISETWGIGGAAGGSASGSASGGGGGGGIGAGGGGGAHYSGIGGRGAQGIVIIRNAR